MTIIIVYKIQQILYLIIQYKQLIYTQYIYNVVMLKQVCNKLLTCIKSIFQTQKQKYKQKLIELQQYQQRIQQSRIKQVSIYDRQSQYYIQPQNKFGQSKQTENSKNHSSYITNWDNKLGGNRDIKKNNEKIKKMNIPSLKSQMRQEMEKRTNFNNKINIASRNNTKQNSGRSSKNIKEPASQTCQSQPIDSKLLYNSQTMNKAKINKTTSNNPINNINSLSIGSRSNTNKSKQKNRSSNNSQDSFHTLQSNSGSINSISRRTFKSFRQSNTNPKSKKYQNSKNINKNIKSQQQSSQQYKQIRNRSSNNTHNNNQMILYQYAADQKNNQQYKQIGELLRQWNTRQYQNVTYNHNNDILTQVTREKLGSNHYLDQLINKLEDYYIFYYHQDINMNNTNLQGSVVDNISKKSKDKNKDKDNNMPIYMSNTPTKSPTKSPTKNNTSHIIQSYQQLQGYYYNNYINYKCSYHTGNYQYSTNNTYQYQHTLQNDNNSTYLKAIQFYCNTTTPTKILKWYNSIEVRNVLFDFQKIKLMENGDYPVIKVQQYSPVYREKNVYEIVRQVQVGRFQGDNYSAPSQQPLAQQSKSHYILQLQTTFHTSVTATHKQFRNLLRFQVGQKALVQIYYESSENIKQGKYPQYYQNKWRHFLRKLQADGIIKK